MRRFLLPLMALPFAATAGEAASFDCAEAAKPDEIAVCSNPELSRLDTQMGALWFAYSRIPFAMGGSGAREDAAEAFLERRAECGNDVDCLRQTYLDRIKVLEDGIARWMREDAETDETQWSAASMPRPVLSIVDHYAEQCSQLGGTLASDADMPLVMTADIDGDGVQDFVLNPQNMQCSAAATAYCGTGGCQIMLALSGNGYQDPVNILGGAPSIGQSEDKGTVLEVWVDSVNCDATGDQGACMAHYSWQDGALQTSYELKPRGD